MPPSTSLPAPAPVSARKRPLTEVPTSRAYHARHQVGIWGPRPTPNASSVSPQPLWPAPQRATDTTRGWIVTALLGVIAALTRFMGLGALSDDGTPIFDEKHYVPQAWQMLHNGGMEFNPGYGLVVHPPLGKHLIALSEAVFGYNPWGWRVSSAIAGTICVILIVRIGRRLAGSTYAGALAGILLICDGMFTVVSRTGLLDIFLIEFVLAALLCLLHDRDQVEDRMVTTLQAGTTFTSEFGPRWGFRWWRFSAGVFLGLATAVKWSGLYFIVVFGLLSVMWDVALRRRYHVSRPWVGTLRRDTFPAIASLAIMPIGIYIASWWSWLRAENAVYRHVGVSHAWWSTFIPRNLQSLWYYHQQMFTFHANLTNSQGYHHPWESKPWQWIANIRPLLYYYDTGVEPASRPHSCGPDGCVQAVLLLGTSVIWWTGLIMLVWAIHQVIIKHDPRYTIILCGYAAAWLPWLLNWDRQMYFFYASALVPFICLGLALMLAQIDGWVPNIPTIPTATSGNRNKPRKHAQHIWNVRAAWLTWCRNIHIGRVIVCAFMGLVIANYVWILTILYGVPISPDLWDLQHWLPSW